MRRATRHGLRKICGCKPAAWAKCSHGWHFAFKWAGVHHRYSLDRILPKAIRLKSDAEAAANNLRAAIQAGTFKAPGSAPAVVVETGPVLPTLTLSQLLDRYRDDYIAVKRPGTLQNDAWQINTITRTVLALPTGEARPFGAWAVADIKAATVQAFQTLRQQKTSHAGNRNLALLRAAFRWAVGQELVNATPFMRAGVNVVKLPTEQRRSRRLEPGEAERLLAACNATVRPLVEAAIETGCRRGELLTLQWNQVRLDARNEIVLPAGKTKSRRERRIPISSRLGQILEMRRTDAEGQDHPPDAYVFGDPATGQALRTFRRGWEAAVLRAHGIRPAYVVKEQDGRNVRTGRLTPDCQQAFARVDLHFHDLRREAGSRWLENGVSLTVIQAWLGHSTLAQTSTYLAAQVAGHGEAMRRFEERQAQARPVAPPPIPMVRRRRGERRPTVN